QLRIKIALFGAQPGDLGLRFLDRHYFLSGVRLLLDRLDLRHDQRPLDPLDLADLGHRRGRDDERGEQRHQPKMHPTTPPVRRRMYANAKSGQSGINRRAADFSPTRGAVSWYRLGLANWGAKPCRIRAHPITCWASLASS